MVGTLLLRDPLKPAASLANTRFYCAVARLKYDRVEEDVHTELVRNWGLHGLSNATGPAMLCTRFKLLSSVTTRF